MLGERNIQDVVLVGGVPYADLPRYYQTADIFCAPSTGKESFGIVLLEAMAAGKPLVATNIEGYSGVITHGHEGLLVPPKDEESLAQALSTLIADSELRRQLGATGRSEVEQFEWDLVSARIIDYYETLLSSSPAHGQSSNGAQ